MRENILARYSGKIKPNACSPLLAELDQLFIRGQSPPIAFVIMYAGLGDADAAFEWLDTAYRLRDGKLFSLTTNPAFDPLRSDPRYTELVHRIGLARERVDRP